MALRILNQNHLSLVKTVGNSTAPLCRRFRCRCMSTTQPTPSSAGKPEDPAVACKEVAELQRRLLIRPLTRRGADELQPKNLPEYGQQQQWATEEHLRYKHGDLDYISVTPKQGLTFTGRRRAINCQQEIPATAPTPGTRAYSTFSPRLQMMNPTGLHPERPLTLSFPSVIRPTQERCFTEDAFKLISTYKTTVGSGLNQPRFGTVLWDRSARVLEAAPTGVLLNFDQTRATHHQHQHKSHKKKTTKRILEEWNRRSSQDYLRIDNILYKYKRKELAKKGLLIEDCPKDKKKQRSGAKDQHKQHPHGKKHRKNKKKKQPGCKNKKLRIKCAGMEENTDEKIEAALDELVGVTPIIAPPATPTLPPSIKQYENTLNLNGGLTRSDTLNYLCDKNNRENQALDSLLNTTPACFSPAQKTAQVGGAPRPFSTTTAVDGSQANTSLQQISKAYSYDDWDLEHRDEQVERADDCLEMEGVKPLPAFRPMKLPAEAMLPPPSLAEAAPLRRLRKRDSVYDEL